MREFDRKLILEDGAEFYGYGFGDRSERLAEVVFNTSMVGYQEILSDPSYTGQAVVMTYPLIGNYGMCAGDDESERPGISGLIVREYNEEPSNFRGDETLEIVMERFGIVGLAGVDTRLLTRHIRDKGACRGLIADAKLPNLIGIGKLRAMQPARDVVDRAGTKTIWKAPAAQPRFHVVAVDCGIKLNILRRLNQLGCDVTVVPWNTPAETVEALRPDGVFFSNGPGDPEDVQATIALARALRGKYPMFGICLGHQVIALSYGAKTYKLKFGHRGGNHPVQNLLTGKVEITSQNHSYAVDGKSLPGTGLCITHINLLDGTVEGLRRQEDRVFSVQYHPESAPGPQDSSYLFDQFIAMMEGKEDAEAYRYS